MLVANVWVMILVCLPLFYIVIDFDDFVGEAQTFTQDGKFFSFVLISCSFILIVGFCLGYGSKCAMRILLFILASRIIVSR